MRTKAYSDLECVLVQEREEREELLVQLEHGVSTSEMALDAGSRRSNQLERALEESRGTILKLEHQLSATKSLDAGSAVEVEALKAKLKQTEEQLMKAKADLADDELLLKDCEVQILERQQVEATLEPRRRIPAKHLSLPACT